MKTTRSLLDPAFIAAVVALGVSAASFQGVKRALGIYLTKLPVEVDRRVHAVPTETRSWVRAGEDRIEAAETLETLGTTNYLTRTYRQKEAPEGEKPAVLDVHIAYYTGLIDTVPHVPERCLVAGGWSQASASRLVGLDLDRSSWLLDPSAPQGSEPVYTARLDSAYTDSVSTRVRLPEGIESVALRTTQFKAPGSDLSLFAGYFFVANGRVAESAEEVRARAFDLRADYAYYLKVQVSSANTASERAYAEAASGLLSELLPEIMRCVPDWIEVQAGRFPPDNPRGANR